MPATLIGRDAQFQARLEPPRPLGAHATDAHNLTELFRTLYDETARAMAAFYQMMANRGTLAGVRLLSPRMSGIVPWVAATLCQRPVETPRS